MLLHERTTFYANTHAIHPANIVRNKYVIITSKSFDVIITVFTKLVCWAAAHFMEVMCAVLIDQENEDDK